MSTGYRAVLRLDNGENSLDLVVAQLSTWLVKKLRGRARRQFDTVDFRKSGTYVLDDSTSMRVVIANSDADRSERLLVRFTETNSAGTWTVSAYAFSRPHLKRFQQTLVVEAALEGANESDAARLVAPPNFVREVLESAVVLDGSTPVYGSPRVIRATDVHEVIDAINDPARTVSVVVASSFSPDLDDAWKNAVANLTSQSVGVATVFVVTSAATAELQRELPFSHRVAPGRIRTFLPGVDLTDPEDGFKHRVLGPTTLTRAMSNGRVRGPLPAVHASVARRRLLDSDLETDIRRGLFLLDRAEAAVLRQERVEEQVITSKANLGDAPTNTPRTNSAAAPLEWLPHLTSFIRRWLGRPSADDVSSELEAIDLLITRQRAEAEVTVRELEALQESKSALEREYEAARRRVEDVELDAAIEAAEARRAQREARILRERLKDAADFGALFVEPELEDWDDPESVQELLSRITPGETNHPITKWITFHGDEDAALEVQGRDPVGRYAAMFWQYARVLHDFAIARSEGYRGNVHQYLSDDTAPAGFKCSPQRHAGTESDTVLNNTNWRKERSFAVPESVSDTGRLEMMAHFKPTHRDTFAPRMHYADHPSEPGKIIIGYIGRHLTNSRTN